MSTVTLGTQGTVLVVSPHPDDEVLGLGATEALLIRAGWTMRNLACSLGRVVDHDRRRRELSEAGQRLGFLSTEMDPLAAIGAGDDLAAASAEVAATVVKMIDTYEPAVVVSPHLSDGHHGHEAVARGVRLALEQLTRGPVWWSYAIWNDLPRPTTYVPYDESVMSRVTKALAAYVGENSRSHFDLMYPARAVVSRILGSERVFGFGIAATSDLPFADLITELRHTASGWQLAAPRLFSIDTPVADDWIEEDLSWWVGSPSIAQLWGRGA